MSQSHLFDVEMAVEYGLNEAILIRHFQFWNDKNKAAGKHLHEGRHWSYGSWKSIAALFPYWSEKQVRTILESLIKQGVLMVGCFNSNAYDRTSWYAFSDEEKFLFCNKKETAETGKCIRPNGRMEKPKRANGSAQMGEPIPDGLTDVKDLKPILRQVAASAPIKNDTGEKFPKPDSCALFEQFWNSFNYKKGRADAFAAWGKIKNLTPELMTKIMQAAKAEADGREFLIRRGATPKMAQGWLTARRWEDEPETSTPKRRVAL